MDKAARSAFSRALEPHPAETIAAWAEASIVFAPPYKAIVDGPFSMELTPFMREPMEAVADPDVREVVLLKPSQAGGSECLLLMPMRHAVCRAPRTVIYVGGEQKATEEFIRERIKPGLQLSPELRARWQTAHVLEHAIYYPDMMIVAGWSKSRGIFKQRPVDLVLADEVDVWPEYAADKLRKRVSTRPHACLVIISALDADAKTPTSRAPIWIEYGATDQRRFMLPDPGKKRARFAFEMGFRDKKSGRASRHGLKWDEKAQTAGGAWDIDRVRATAHYVTPAGAVIHDRDKLALLTAGKWRATRKTHDKSKRGYRLSSFYMPWITFGELAARFLTALERGKGPLRVFVYEDLAEAWTDHVESATEDDVQRRQAEYAKGERLSQSAGTANEDGATFAQIYIKKRTAVYLTVDVQKFDLWWTAREWIEGGDSGLLDYGSTLTWQNLNKLASKRHGCGASRVLVDSNYDERRQEVYEACWKYKLIPTTGKENIPDMLFVTRTINPFEGTRRAADRLKIGLILFKTDPFKTQLLRRIRGEAPQAWHVYHDIELEYVRQVDSEHKVDGVWLEKRTSQGNHLWDCEVLQLLAATRWGFNRFKGFSGPTNGDAGTNADGRP